MTEMHLSVREREGTPQMATVSADPSAAGKGSAPRITAIIPRGEVIRNFVHSGAFDELSNSAVLSLVTVSPGNALTSILRKDYGATYPLVEFDERWLVRIQRDLIDMAHGRWLWSRAAERRWRIRDAEAVTLKQRIYRTLKKTAVIPFASRFGLKALSRLERVSSRVLSTTDEYVEMFNRIRPHLVFNGSHVHSRNAIQAVQAAQWLGIPTATFVFSWDNLTSQGRILLPYDHYLVWNEELKDQMLEIYEWIKPEQIHVTGTPQFDFHFREEFYRTREEFCSEIGADPGRPIVLYSTGMPNHMPGETEIVEEIADLLKDIPEGPQLLVRVYAKDLTGRFEELKRRRPDILFPDIAWEREWLTPRFEDSFALVNTLRHCALGINVASTISLELCMFDKPAINIGYNPASVDPSELRYADYYEFDHYMPIVESGAVEVAVNAEDLRGRVEKALREPGERSEMRSSLLRKMFGETLDGCSASRVAGTLLSIAEAGARK